MAYGDGAFFLPANEENEEQIFIMHSDLYRFDKDSSNCKFICSGPVKLMRHATKTRQLRLVMMDRTLKIRLDHLVLPGTKVVGWGETGCRWSAAAAATDDVADDGKPKHQDFRLDFPTKESLETFVEMFQGIYIDPSVRGQLARKVSLHGTSRYLPADTQNERPDGDLMPGWSLKLKRAMLEIGARSIEVVDGNIDDDDEETRDRKLIRQMYGFEAHGNVIVLRDRKLKGDPSLPAAAQNEKAIGLGTSPCLPAAAQNEKALGLGTSRYSPERDDGNVDGEDDEESRDRQMFGFEAPRGLPDIPAAKHGS
ncbi:hypothetical protein PTKIN_Ptkin03bG0019100 [Pterospermum kingtungense]